MSIGRESILKKGDSASTAKKVHFGVVEAATEVMQKVTSRMPGPSYGSSHPAKVSLPPAGDEFEVEAIVDHKKVGRQVETTNYPLIL
jgi:hypothetical protein